MVENITHINNKIEYSTLKRLLILNFVVVYLILFWLLIK